MPVACAHEILSFDCSPYGSQAGYSRPTAKQRENAATLEPASKGKLKRTVPDDAGDSGPFSAPLVLPGDDLSEDPEYPPQSIHEWQTDEDRNEVKPGKNTIYVAAPPTIDSDISFVKSWSEPKHADSISVEAPKIEEVAEYLKAFYHGMPVKLLPPPALRLTQWGDGKLSKTPRYIGLNTATECVRIRTRASQDGVFARQLNLDDLLDAAISLLPDDAFALLLLVPFDIYESPDDDFACGRAYGGSRVAVISTARYHPGLDRYQKVDRMHSWPASHCKRYIDACCSEADNSKPKKKKSGKSAEESGSFEPTSYAALSPLHAAVVAHEALPSLEESPSSAALSALWLGRACRTASHELGHCLGIDHCVYYACSMQGTASLAEDARQPPFLCPVDLAKMLHASGADREERYRAILDFCSKHPQCHLFAAFAAWIRPRLSEDSANSKRTKASGGSSRD
ncbi:hypothetical protein DFH08DRAFT_729441 [Mycena albidolilacea]|uniref:Archaemetzincin-2 n=1 Tax=Mycena albidolilacea TaxID=1033008 RepID=A0AAD7F516_9AGAR|nr:hypothetical protein DFH08DRAFT_729441 [Mycena albidolilacea]